jgi:hypothetical protein
MELWLAAAARARGRRRGTVSCTGANHSACTVANRKRISPACASRPLTEGYALAAPAVSSRSAAALWATWVGPHKSPNKKPPRMIRGGVLHTSVKRYSVLGRPGSDLLFQALRLSTIGAGEFNGRVRDGIGFGLPARTTRPAKDRWQRSDVRNSGSRSNLRASWPSENVI